LDWSYIGISFTVVYGWAFDERAVISRTEEMKTRAVSIAEAGVPQVSIAVDTYFPRAHLIECLRRLQADFPTVAAKYIYAINTKYPGSYRLKMQKEKIDRWRWDYNELRPHRSLKGLTPREYLLRSMQGVADSQNQVSENTGPITA
jgi:transposase InsO family protein